MAVKLTDCIGEAFYGLHHDIKQGKHINYWLEGGRGSLKSSFAALETIHTLTHDALRGNIRHAVGLRKVHSTIRDSLFSKLLWAIRMLNLTHVWRWTVNPLALSFNGNTILFRGCANEMDYEKIKSLTFGEGYCKIVLFEELTEFSGMDEVTNILQSLLRGGDEASAFYMYNPPASKQNWVNLESKVKKSDTIVHMSNYLQVPPHWLGRVFLETAEYFRLNKPRQYRHMYMGEPIGQGLEIFPRLGEKNGVLEIRSISDEEIKGFDRIYRGLDFGYSNATAYVEVYYDIKKDYVYIVDQVYMYGASNQTLVNAIKPKAKGRYINGDSEDPRTINEMNILGLNVGKAKKGKDSKPHGIKWLQDRAKIIIDKKRTPDIAEDFEGYEYKKGRDGRIIFDFPKEPDGVAATRYALESIIQQKQIVFSGRR